MQTDVLIIGSGIAGAISALQLAKDSQRQITVLTLVEDALESNSRYAQGGIVGRGIQDSAKLLKEDIIKAGAGLSNPPAVDQLANLGPKLLEKILIDEIDVPFDRDDQGDLVFGLEAAHSKQRIIHVSDMTGKSIMTTLLNKLEEKSNVTLLRNHTAIDLITFPHHAVDPLKIYESPICLGAYTYNQNEKKVIRILANQTILATGGLGQIFQNTTNPTTSRGDGLAMAYRAGARILNAEYIQFHPTALYNPGPTRFLISEAVRGEGAVLLTPNGDSFIEKYAPEWKELAPRDVVARAIYWEMLHNDYPHVFLDISSIKKPGEIKNRFPQIYENCLKFNIDISSQPIPVVPAAHYFCGGVQVDLNGQSSIPGLYAIGEVSCTGVHGANRLASTSLLEGLVWGHQAAEHIRSLPNKNGFSEKDVPKWFSDNLRYEPDPALIQVDMASIRNLMWHYVGLIRNQYQINRAIRDLTNLRSEIENFYRKTLLSDGLIGLRNGIQAAQIVTHAASQNRTSRGAHYREDTKI
ncbi:MAG: L-aspartate oxidase [Chloroflexi bacterium]|jgi:L-aspartate oxidase|nr:L-aspartate oxidase [Chloroflexota bacterium]MBT3671262.1 L-aspartate oxidase [Chloroflexota bacterium]MBT4004346.1 L-aspartate oxidase [Chloroflexota bacterium]MBT4304279.1 L-aspartate oxidase [Chloroflexota bacterium]MBT4534298.1 L-aspartate oxidase [Chloroflexota bacterium]